VHKLPSVVSDQTRREGSALLVEQAAELSPDHLDRLGRHLIQVLDPEHGAALERDEVHQAETEELSLRVGHDGKRAARGEFSAANGMLLQAALDAVMAPTHHQDPDGRRAKDTCPDRGFRCTGPVRTAVGRAAEGTPPAGRTAGSAGRTAGGAATAQRAGRPTGAAPRNAAPTP
jgi:hypothetical protein